MTEFRVLPQSQLSEQDFVDHPVWSEHYDWEEIEDIERWGLDREHVLRLFKENSPGNEHCVYTLLEFNPFPGRMRIFILAVITAADGCKLKGFVMNEDAFCLTIFHAGRQFIFSRHPMFAAENKKSERQLMESMGRSGTIFPIRYETEFNDNRGALIAGTFMYGENEA